MAGPRFSIIAYPRMRVAAKPRVAFCDAAVPNPRRFATDAAPHAFPDPHPSPPAQRPQRVAQPNLHARSRSAVMNIRDITTDVVRARLSALLRRHVGRGMVYSVKDAAEIVDVDPRTLDSYVAGDRAPSLDTFLRLVLLPKGGAGILNEMLDLAGYVAQTTRPGDANPFHMNAELVGALRDLADMLADGRIDHTEDPKWQGAALDLAQKLIAHVAARRTS